MKLPTVAAGGTTYATVDTIVLACPGVSFTSAPIIGVWNVSGSAVASPFTLTYGGLTNGPPLNSTVTCTQASTSGSGTGATFTVSFAPASAGLSVGTLTSGNGNLFINNWEGAPLFAGTETTLIGDKAGAGLKGSNAFQDTALGHNACGTGGSGGGIANTVCIGTDSMRNAQGTDIGDTWVGTFSGRNTGGLTGKNTGVGYETVASSGNNPGFFTGSWDNTYGAFSGNGLTTGSGNLIMGVETALTSGNDNVLLIAGHSGSAACDAPTGGTSNTVMICAGAGAVYSVTGGATPATSVTTVAGLLTAQNFTAIAVAPTVSAGQIAYGGTTAAATNCGSLAGAAGCVVLNVAGTARYVPYY